jgi:hypothetical protein
MNREGFWFDEAAHAYYEGDKPLVGVTRRLQEKGIVDYSFMPAADREYYMARGRAVHEALRLIILGRFDRRYLDQVPECAPYIVAGESFLVQTRCKVIFVEQRIWHPLLGYAGTIDLIIQFGNWLVVPDWKCTKAERAARIQTGAYTLGVPYLGPQEGYIYADEPHRRLAIELRRDGTFRANQWYDDVEDQQVWVACLKDDEHSKAVVENWIRRAA